jgi:glycosyltransferase involved in cell wall biosynthesis
VGGVKVVVDVSPLSHPRTGVGNYIRGSLRGLAQTGHEIVAFAPASHSGRRAIESALAGIDVELRVPMLPAAHAVRTLWSNLGRPPVERILGAFDVLHFSDWMYPPQSGGVRSTMIHDLVPLHHPEWVHSRTRRMHGAKYEHAAHTADVIVVNSEFTRADVVSTLDFPRGRTFVAYPGVDAVYTPDGERAEGDYVLAVGTLEPRKNLEVAIAATRGRELRIVGGRGWGGVEARGEHVTWLGPLHDEQLARQYRGAAAVVYPSRFEGFGMPVVEAMACGTPVVASSHPSLDEASGDAALRADPDDPDAVAAVIDEAIARRDELVPRGVEHARRFTWEANARAHLEAWS